MKLDLHLQELTANRSHRRPLIHPTPVDFPTFTVILYTVTNARLTLKISVKEM